VPLVVLIGAQDRVTTGRLVFFVLVAAVMVLSLAFAWWSAGRRR
jgi:hypothetical protein